MKTTANLIAIINSGAGIIIDGSTRSTTSLQQIAQAATTAGVTVTFKNISQKTTVNLQSIAQLGNGKVIFEL